MKIAINGKMISLIIGIILVYIAIQGTELKKEKSNQFFENWDVWFSGIVKEKKEVFSDSGLLFLDIVKSNKDFYDQRDSLKYYYCVIKNGRAELVEGGLSEINIGDSIVVDGNLKKIFQYRNSTLLKVRKLYVSAFDPYYNAIKRLHRL